MKNLISEAIRRSISRRSFLKGMGSLAAVPLFTGLGGSVLTGCSSSSSADPGDGSGTKLVIIGSSGGVGYWPGSNRASSSSALVVNGTIYLIDLGQGSMAMLNQAFDSQNVVDTQKGTYNQTASTYLSKVKALFFTHLHQDHIADYPELLLIGPGTGLGSTNSKGFGTSPLQVIGPCNRGQLDNNNNSNITNLDEWVINAYSPVPPLITPTPGTIQMTDMIWQAFAQAINDIMLDDGYPNYTSLLTVREIGTQLPTQGSNTCPAIDPFPVYEDGNVKVWATLVDHRQVYPAFAYRFETNDGTVIFSGDTGPNTTADRTLNPASQDFSHGNLQALANLNGGADVLVHEVIDPVWIAAKFGNPTDTTSPAYKLMTHMQNAHTQVNYVGKVATYCNVKTLVLNHIIPGMAPVVNLQPAQNDFQGNLIISEDLMQIQVTKTGGRVTASRR